MTNRDWELIPGSSSIFFFCGRSAVLRPAVHKLPGIGWCGAGLPPFPTACLWLTHPAAITGVSVAARWDSPGGCGGPSVPLLCNRRVQILDKRNSVDHTTLFRREEHGKVDHQLKNEAAGRECKHVSDQRANRTS